MHTIRHKPKWLAFLIPISLALSVMGAPGCSSNDDKSPPRPPVYNQETGIANITISNGELQPAFSETVRNYGVSMFYAPTPNINVTVTLKDSKSRLTIDGKTASSGQAATVALNPEGNTTFNISVDAEDGRSSNIVSITTNQIKPNTKVYVYDSIGGNPLDGDVRLMLRDSQTNELLAKDIAFPMEAQGTVFLGLDKNRRYNIYARRSDTAMACFADFDPMREDTVVLYSRRDWVQDIPASAPIITNVEFAAIPPSGSTLAQAEWKEIPPGVNHIEDIPANLYLLKVTAIAESNILQAGGRGAIMVNIDEMASTNHQYVRALGVWQYANEPVGIDGKRYVKTDLFFNLSNITINTIPGNNLIGPGEHFLSIVVYDWANNRTERKVYLSVTNNVTTTDVDFTAFKPFWYRLTANTYGMPLDLYSRGPAGEDAAPMQAPSDAAGPNGDTIYVHYDLEFRQTAPYGTVIVGFRGYELERAASPDGPWKVVRRRSYAAPTSGSRGYQIGGQSGGELGLDEGYDNSAELVGGQTYYYRARVFNNTGYSQYSDVQAINILPSFNVNLAAPANQAVSDTLYPTFKFRITNDALFDATKVWYCSFTLFVRDKNGAEALKAHFQVRYQNLDAEGNPRVRMEYPIGSLSYDFIDQKTIVEDGVPKTIEIAPFVWLEDDGVIVVDARLAQENFAERFPAFQPGTAYEWNIFGDNASGASNWPGFADTTYIMYFYNSTGFGQAGLERQPIASWSFASNRDEGLGATNGYFTLIMHQSAE